MSSAQVMLAPGTGSATSEPIEVSQLPITASLTGALLGGADVINVQYSADGTAFLNAFDYVKGAQVNFSSTVSLIELKGAGFYRFVRGAIATSTGVSVAIGRA